MPTVISKAVRSGLNGKARNATILMSQISTVAKIIPLVSTSIARELTDDLASEGD